MKMELLTVYFPGARHTVHVQGIITGKKDSNS